MKTLNGPSMGIDHRRPATPENDGFESSAHFPLALACDWSDLYFAATKAIERRACYFRYCCHPRGFES
jgi:hypothetical protein